MTTNTTNPTPAEAAEAAEAERLAALGLTPADVARALCYRHGMDLDHAEVAAALEAAGI